MLFRSVEVTAQELRFWSIVASAAENGEIRSGSDGRPPNRQLQSLSYAIAHAYWILTGKIPPIAANGNQSKPFEKYQSFFLDVLKALEVSSVVSHYASAAAKEVRKSLCNNRQGSCGETGVVAGFLNATRTRPTPRRTKVVGFCPL